MGFFDSLRKKEKNEPIEKKATQEVVVSQIQTPAPTAETKQTLHEQRTAIEQQLTDLATDYRHLKGQLKLKVFAEKAEQQQGLKQAQQELALLADRTQQTAAHIQELKNADDSAATAAITDLQQQQTALQTKIDQSQAHLDSLQRELDDTTEAIRKVILAIDQNEKQSDALSTDIKAETDLQKMYELMNQQKPEVDDLYQKKTVLISTREDLNTKITALAAQRDQAANETAELHQQQSKLAQQQRQQEATLQQAQEQRQRELTEAQNYAGRLEQETNRSNRRAEKLTKSIKDLQDHIQSLFDNQFLLRPLTLDTQRQYVVYTPALTSEKMTVQLALLHYLTKQLTVAPMIITTDYQQNGQQAQLDQLAQADLPQIEITNLYAQLQSSGEDTAPQVQLPQNDNWVQKADVANNRTSIFDKDQHLLMTVHLQQGNISQIDYFTNGKKVKTNLYNAKGQLSAHYTFDEHERLTTIDYYRLDNTIVLTKTFNKQQALETIQLFDDHGLVTHVFATEDELITWWLQALLETLDREYTLIGSLNVSYYPTLMTALPKLTVIPLLTGLPQQQKELVTLLKEHPQQSQFLVGDEHDWQVLADNTDRDLEVDVLQTAALALPRDLTTTD
ncbi:coiled-coil domain-containing protein [Lapidilactobacillus gannanensis]|uniref:Uncharacterized protein n=1 Tax=Lapidilactobacillus gannanensis TaxID=2486002 RepID=A0ABW4BM67_9LACO|nr:hypothetical protein [Lapidilactobacillus gannanensis]